MSSQIPISGRKSPQEQIAAPPSDHSISSPDRLSIPPIPTDGLPFHRDFQQLAESYDCVIEAVGENPKWYLLRAKLPLYLVGAANPKFLALYVTVRPTETSYSTDWRIEAPDETLPWDEAKLAEFVELAKIRYEDIHGPQSITKGPSTRFLVFIDSFYEVLEKAMHPEKVVVIRDYCYGAWDPRYWGRPLPGQLGRNNAKLVYKARAKFDFDGVADGELSIRENDLLLVLANLGNGWISVRKQSPSSPSEGESFGVARREDSGLVPENYVQKI